jgi:hypothetical protein
MCDVSTVGFAPDVRKPIIIFDYSQSFEVKRRVIFRIIVYGSAV